MDIEKALAMQKENSSYRKEFISGNDRDKGYFESDAESALKECGVLRMIILKINEKTKRIRPRRMNLFKFIG
jgi:hypothetical protein